MSERDEAKAEVERLRAENRHHRETAMNSVSRALHEAAIVEQAAEIKRQLAEIERLRAALEGKR